MEIKPKIYNVSNREIHMVGKWVGVVWDTRDEKKRVRGDDGAMYTVNIPTKISRPIIEFIWLHENEDGTVYEDESNRVDDGFSPSDALQIAEELRLTVEYMEQFEVADKQIRGD